MDDQVQLSEKLIELAQLKIEIDLQKVRGGASAVDSYMEAQYEKKYEELLPVVNGLREKLLAEIKRIQGEGVKKSSAEKKRRALEEVAMQERRLSDMESRLESIDNRVKQLLNVDSPAKATGVRKLDFANWRSWTFEDKCLASLYFLPVFIVLILLCSAIYRILSAESVEINVELNIAELIGGSLIGLGTALAGGAYAFKTYKEIRAE